MNKRQLRILAYKNIHRILHYGRETDDLWEMNPELSEYDAETLLEIVLEQADTYAKRGGRLEKYEVTHA